MDYHGPLVTRCYWYIFERHLGSLDRDNPAMMCIACQFCLPFAKLSLVIP